MNKGEELLKAWQICEKVCNECERLIKSFAAQVVRDDWDAFQKNRGLWVFASSNSNNKTKFLLHKNLVQVFKLKDKDSKFFRWTGLYFIFDPERIKKFYNVQEPLIYSAKIHLTKSYHEWIAKKSAPEIADELDLLYDDNENLESYAEKKFPDPDGLSHDYKFFSKDDPASGMEAKVTGFPLVQITDEEAIQKNLIRPLFG